jgi:hypothetical protein
VKIVSQAVLSRVVSPNASTFDEMTEVAEMFKKRTGRTARLDIAIDGYCINFPIWIFSITLG